MSRSNHALALLNEFPSHRMFQFFVDGSMHAKEQGDVGFEKREPGCMSAFYNAFNFAIRNIDKKLDLELILNIHRLASEKVNGVFGVLTPGKFRTSNMDAFRVPYERFTKAGIMSFMASAEEAKIGELTGYSTRGHSLTFKLKDEFVQRLLDSNAIEPNLNLFPPFDNEKDILARANFLIEELESKLANAQAGNNDDIIKAIVHFVRFMELLHPFPDANGRVFVNVILNFLLIQNNFLPVTLYEPNIFDLYSDDELVDAIKDAISHTLFTLKNPQHPLFGYVAPIKANAQIEIIKATISSAVDQNQSKASIDKYILDLESYLDTVWDKKFNLHRFCATGEIDKLKQYSDDELKSNCTLIAPEFVAPLYKGLAPLHIACKLNNEETIYYLLNIDKKIINQKDFYGNTPLYYAIQNKNYPLVKNLLDSGAQLDVKNEKAESPADWAVKYGTPEIFNKIQGNLNLPFSNYPDEMKLKMIEDAASNNNLDMLKWIIDEQKTDFVGLMCRLNVEFGSYRDPMYLALQKKSVDTFQFLLSLAFPHKNMSFSIFENYLSEIVKDADYGLFELVLAHVDLTSKLEPINVEILEAGLIKRRRDFQIPFRLIELEKDIANIKNFDGFPLVSLAAAFGLKEILAKLIEKGCDLYQDVNGETPLSLASRNNRLEVIRYLVDELKIDPNYIPQSVQKSQDPFFLFFPREPETEYLSPLATAVREGHVESVKLLLDLGAIINKQVEDSLSKCVKHKNDIELLLQENIANLQKYH